MALQVHADTCHQEVGFTSLENAKLLENSLRDSHAWMKRVTQRTEFYRVTLEKKRDIYTQEHVTFKHFLLD